MMYNNFVVNRENEFEDGNHFYRFLEHGPFISRCFNFRGSVNDNEPKPAAIVAQKLTKIMSAILESHASQDLQHLDYLTISNTEEFRRYNFQIFHIFLGLFSFPILHLALNKKLRSNKKKLKQIHFYIWHCVLLMSSIYVWL